MQEINYVDVFSGAGGLSLGLYNAGLKGLFAIEKNEDAFLTLKSNLIDNHKHFDWPDWLPITSHDVVSFLNTYKEFLKTIRGKVDLVAGGPPCQGFSMAGERKHTDLRNSLVYSYLELIDMVRPKYVFFENVRGIKHKFKEDNVSIPYSEIVVQRLIKMGYKVNHSLVDMSDFGIPQKRVRYILVASYDSDFANNFFDILNSYKMEFLNTKGLNLKTSINEAIGDLLHKHGTTPCEDSSPRFKSGEYGMISSPYQKLMRNNCSKKPNSHRFSNNTISTKNLYNEVLSKGIVGKRITPTDNVFTNLKRRGITLLNGNGQSPTITSNPDEIVHYCEPRNLTPRETARIQSFPDWYEFKGKYTTGGKLRKIDVPRYTQIANAVPPLFAEIVGNIIINWGRLTSQ